MPTPVTGTNNLHAVSRQPLGDECKVCGHRALPFADRVDDFRATCGSSRGTWVQTCKGADVERLSIRLRTTHFYGLI